MKKLGGKKLKPVSTSQQNISAYFAFNNAEKQSTTKGDLKTIDLKETRLVKQTQLNP